MKDKPTNIVRVRAGDLRRRIDEVVSNADALAKVLDRVTAAYPGEHVVVSMCDEEGNELLVGLGPDYGAVSFGPASGKSVSHAKADPVPPVGESEVPFAWHDDWAYVTPDGLIPVSTARTIAERWLTEGMLDDSVEWWTQTA